VKTRKRLVGLASVASLVIWGSSAPAQVPITPPVSAAPVAPLPIGAPAAPAVPAAKKPIYTSKTSFRLPVLIKDPRERARLTEVQLYVKSGGANGTWVISQKAKPDADHFDYLVPQDGEYWFRLVTVDAAGHMNPPDISRVEPSLVVVVDTKKPDCEVKAVQGLPGELVLQCDIHDDNADVSKTKLEYMSGDKWVPLPAHATMAGCFQVSDLAVLKNPVRATAYDMAKNMVVREFSVTPQNTAAVTAAPTAPVTTPVTTPGSTPAPITPAVANATPVPGSTPMETIVEKPTASNVATLLVKGTKVPLDYQFEGTPGRVVVWVTTDNGQTWHHLCDDADRKSPVEVEFPGEGRYGVCLSACAAEGDPKAPAKGDAPDCWVEVDCTQPAANIIAIRPGAGKDEAGTILITWSAADKNLKSEPIDLYYSTKQGGPWVPMAKGLKNDGNYRWHYPADLAGSDVFVRMDVTDKAGNVARCEGIQPPGSSPSPAPSQAVTPVSAPTEAPAPSKPKIKLLGVSGNQ
jgi:hypothetical protein